MGETKEDKVNVEGSNGTEKISFEFDKMGFREGLWNKIRYGSENYPYEQMALELMAKHNEFYGELNKVEDEYALRGAVLSCTHGNRYIRLDMCQDHGVYSQGIPVMTCNDYKIDDNIFSFGLCGNSQYDPVYSETAPPPAETGVDKDGNVRHICCPILLEKWGYGIGSSRFNNKGALYFIENCDSYVNESDMPSECLTEMQHGDEQGEEYAEALTTRDNLICLYSGVITIEENPEPEEGITIEENSEMEELEEENSGLPRGEEIYLASWLKAYKGEPEGKNGRRVYYDKEARELLRTDYPKIDWYSYEEQTEKNRNCAHYLEGQEFISTDRGVLIDEKERYWITLGPRVIDSDYPDTGNCQAEYFADSIGCRVDVVLSKMDNKDEHIYLECVWSGNIKAHTGGNGIYQTGVPYINSTQAKTEPFKEEYVNGSIVEFTGKDPHETGTMSEYMVDYLIVYPKEQIE